MSEFANEPKPNPFARLIGALFSPVETFASIARRPDWLVPLLLIVVVAIVSSVILTPRMDIEGMMREQMAGRKDVSQEEIDSAIKIMKKVQPFSAVFQTVVVPVTVLAAAGLFFVALQMFGGDARFSQILAVTLYGWLPIVLQRLLLAVVALPRARIRPERMAGLLKSNLAGFVPTNKPALLTIVSSIDLFYIWTLILLIIGYAFASKLKRGTVAAIVITVWIVIVLLFAGLAGLGGMMQGRS